MLTFGLTLGGGGGGGSGGNGVSSTTEFFGEICSDLVVDDFDDLLLEFCNERSCSICSCC